MNTGHGGTLSTIHASSAVDALNRLANLALSARPNLNHTFMRSETEFQSQLQAIRSTKHKAAEVMQQYAATEAGR